METVLRWALEYVHEHRMSVVPVRGKKPIEKWHVYRERFPTDQELKLWFSDGQHNIALVCGEISETTVLDADSIEAEEFIYEQTDTDRVVETGSGRIHAHYAYVPFPNKVNLFGIGLDVRNDGGLAVLPPSIHECGNRYSWLQCELKGDLDVESLKPKDQRPISQNLPLLACQQADSAIQITLNYLSRMEPAVSGQRGHSRMFRAACVIRERLSQFMSPDEALPILATFNVRCLPPFTEKECLHKLNEAWKRKV